MKRETVSHSWGHQLETIVINKICHSEALTITRLVHFGLFMIIDQNFKKINFTVLIQQHKTNMFQHSVIISITLHMQDVQCSVV